MSLPPIVALEIGTSKVRALIGEAREDGQLMIVGLGQCPARGMRKGEVVDFENAVACVRTALREAEETGHVIINTVHLLVSGGQVLSMVNRGSVPVMSDTHEISEDDIEHAMDTARAVHMPPDREVLHTICQHFLVDDEARVINPEGMEGSKLAVDMLIIHGIRNRLRNLVKVVHNVPLEVEDVAFGGLCSALGVLSAEQKEGGVLLIDLGAGTTDYVAYARNSIAMAGALALGGDHATNDIATGLQIPIRIAERLKEAYGHAIVQESAQDQTVSLNPDGSFPGGRVNVGDLQTIVHLRIEEILNMVKAEVEKRDLLHLFGAGVALTGGGANLRSITKLAENVFGMPCNIAKPLDVSGLAVATEGPEYAATVGLIRYGFKAMQRDRGTSRIGSFFRKIMQAR